jgi:DNA-binding NtrC family response regulator
MEREAIEEALAATEGNVTRAAQALGLSRRGLQLKMKELGLRT